ncbi:porin [Candidatus Vallotia tarda]|uniref:Outer membrane porin protein 32 n=1 Tax=Candidatus Vallotiella hemipterorum TaxID=1177213 RepID=A0A8D9CGN2_9BURK|nr:porin [Candidatus Vallotia tarda]CAD6506720.1 Outer membrane porin protein 32 [Candidatus Vallotia tarda]CAG7605370.1 Outer membrane porin protein 32 [Candidatus Vallotia tarda]
MKRLALSAISLGVLATAASAAHAQSAVTLYGTIEKNVNFFNEEGKNQWATPAGTTLSGTTLSGAKPTGTSTANAKGSCWGLSGSEDVGSSVKAIFKLENSFNINNGYFSQGSQEFGRQAYVGLQHDAYGTVTVGRQYVPDTDLLHKITAGSYLGSAFATPGDVDNYNNSIRVNNSIKYTSPMWSGLQFESLYAFGNQAGTLGGRRSWGAALGRTNGPVSIAASYQHYSGGKITNGVRNIPDTTMPSTKIATDSIFNSPINSAYASASSLKVARVASQYTIGPVKIGTSYSNAQYMADSASLFKQTQKYNTCNVSAIYQATPALLTGIGYSYTKSSGNSSAKYNQVSLGANYSLSKRTDVYLIGAWQKATGQQNSTGDKAQASIGSCGFSSTNSGAQGYVSLGLRHRF